MKEHFAEDLTDRHEEETKSVELTELFYDLVYVFAIAQISHTILNGKNGDIPLDSFMKYIVMTLVFYSVWSYQTAYTNRFGALRPKDVVFLLFNMFIAIFLAISLDKHFSEVFDAVNICIAILYFSTSLQFFLSLLDKITDEDRFAAITFGTAMLISAVLATFSIVLSSPLMYIFFGLAIVTACVFPMPFTKKLKQSAINVPHMVERYTLLTIIMFGETIIGLTKIFKIDDIKYTDFLLFLIIVSLFGSYWMKTNRLISYDRYASGMTLTIAHFFILIGLGMVNASLILDANNDVTNLFKVQLMYGALGCYFTGLLLTLNYSHEDFKHDKHMIVIMTAILIAGFFIEYLLKDAPYTLPISTSIITVSIFFVSSYIYRTKYPQE
ncbi:low temperature requirement protein A [Macrococcus equipercicus]|uniref:Low temperature requirement protein A n=1 Tax=Macrococcus equipercicus TaxID=69967 RepID=A0A9Q9F1L4_9STAP|nr:low temperature requirement protein A [Macrococcus equipercicus]KAA1036586.1 hypothetical protein ERX35_010575 [Macrococcus equipercicus]UTH13481.1 low temperature requirement protein A [Macrococcus equipercicus]